MSQITMQGRMNQTKAAKRDSSRLWLASIGPNCAGAIGLQTVEGACLQQVVLSPALNHVACPPPRWPYLGRALFGYNHA